MGNTSTGSALNKAFPHGFREAWTFDEIGRMDGHPASGLGGPICHENASIEEAVGSMAGGRVQLCASSAICVNASSGPGGSAWSSSL